MANIKISELNPLLTVEDADVLPIVDNAVTKKVTAAILRSYTQGNSVLLTGAQTIAGIKTFTSQLASSVATGTAPFSVASTTKVTNLNADLLDGLSSADFATLTGTQTLTNKTLTSPIINEILDSNGNEILGFTPIASATDYITIKNGIGVGVPLHISAAGSSTNTGLHLEPKGTGLVQISDGTDTTKGFRFRSSGSAASAVTLIDAVSSAGRVITLPNATTTLVGTNTTDTLTNKSIAGDTNTLSNIGNASLTNSAITINGTSTSLGGSINVGTVTSVAALTLGTSGTDLTSSVATGTTTPVITLNVPTASASNRGALSSTDWSTFNGKQNAITLTTTGTSGAATLVGSTLNIPNYADTDTGITSLNGLTALTQTFAVGTSGTDFGISSATSTHTFNLPTASATNRGALSSADWTTFNNKASTAALANYLPLAGGTLTGALEINNNALTQDGTRPIITLKQSGTSKLLLGISSVADDIIVGDVAGDVDFRTNSQAFNFSVNNGGSIAFKLASNAAATFSSSVTASSLIKSGGTSSQYLMADGSTSTLTNPITGTGTTNYLPKFTGASALGNSIIQENATGIGIGGSANYLKFEVIGATSAKRLGIGTNVYLTNSMDILALSNIGADIPLGISGETIGFYTNSATERMRITSAGNVGIGKTDPSEMLEVQNAAAGAKIKVSNSGGGYATLECSSNASSVAQLSFTNQLSLMGGNVGIGTTSPARLLDVNGAMSWGTAAGSYMYAGGSSHIFAFCLSTGNYLYSGGANGLTINNAADTQNLARFVDNGNFLLGTTTDVASSKLTIDSTTQGVLVPRMTTTQINAISSPATGLIAYNTTLGTLCFYDGSGWRKVSHSSM